MPSDVIKIAADNFGHSKSQTEQNRIETIKTMMNAVKDFKTGQQ